MFLRDGAIRDNLGLTPYRSRRRPSGELLHHYYISTYWAGAVTVTVISEHQDSHPAVTIRIRTHRTLGLPYYLSTDNPLNEHEWNPNALRASRGDGECVRSLSSVGSDVYKRLFAVSDSKKRPSTSAQTSCSSSFNERSAVHAGQAHKRTSGDHCTCRPAVRCQADTCQRLGWSRCMPERMI